MATHTSIVALGIPGMEEPGGLWSRGPKESEKSGALSTQGHQQPQPPDGELVSPEGTQEGKDTCRHLAAIRLQPLPAVVSQQGTQQVKNTAN